MQVCFYLSDSRWCCIYFFCEPMFGLALHTRFSHPPYLISSLMARTSPFPAPVTNLGVRFDPQLNFDDHIKQLFKTSFYHLKNISKLRPSLTLSEPEKNLSTLLSPQDWTTVTCSSQGSLAAASRSSSTEPSALLHHTRGTAFLTIWGLHRP